MITISFAQIQVFSDGKVGIRSDTSNLGDVQINIREGDNKGLCIYDSFWNQNKLRITSEEDVTYLFDSFDMSRLGFVNGEITIATKNQLHDCGGKLNVIQSSPMSQYGLIVYTTTNDGTGISSTHSSNTATGVSIHSHVYKNTSMPYASSYSYNQGYNFYVNGLGEVYSQGIKLTSDSTLKKDIKPLQESLSKIMKLRGVSFKFKTEIPVDRKEEAIEAIRQNTKIEGDQDIPITHSSNTKINKPELNPDVIKTIEKEMENATHIGFLAQDVEKVLPELVSTTVNGTKAINYIELIALLTEGIKEQQLTIEKQEQTIQALSNKVANIESIISINDQESQLRSSNEKNITRILDNNVKSCILYQNTPNPFTQNTQIKFYISENVKNASLCIYNLQGIQLKQIPLFQRGESFQQISGSEFSAGIYLYALIVEGQEVDVKRMILTK
jgi:hypothetical protein